MQSNIISDLASGPALPFTVAGRDTAGAPVPLQGSSAAAALVRIMSGALSKSVKRCRGHIPALFRTLPRGFWHPDPLSPPIQLPLPFQPGQWGCVHTSPSLQLDQISIKCARSIPAVVESTPVAYSTAASRPASFWEKCSATNLTGSAGLARNTLSSASWNIACTSLKLACSRVSQLPCVFEHSCGPRCTPLNSLDYVVCSSGSAHRGVQQWNTHES